MWIKTFHLCKKDLSWVQRFVPLNLSPKFRVAFTSNIVRLSRLMVPWYVTFSTFSSRNLSQLCTVYGRRSNSSNVSGVDAIEWKRLHFNQHNGLHENTKWIRNLWIKMFEFSHLKDFLIFTLLFTIATQGQYIWIGFVTQAYPTNSIFSNLQKSCQADFPWNWQKHIRVN